MLKGKTVILGVTGSIAAYKIANLASMLVKLECNVHVIMTKNATNFINPITFETLTGNKCLIDTFDRNFNYNVEHIALAKKADAFVVAPATANVIGKIAAGIADDMLTTTIMACSCKKMISPVMNTNMFLNPILQDNLMKLKEFGYEIITPDEGRLACGDTGIGKMPSEDKLIDYILREINFEKDMVGIKVLVTAGATMEAMDPVRFITNHSTGKMGFAIARCAMERGADVTVVAGNTTATEPAFVNISRVKNAEEMFVKVMELASDFDIIIKTAAVSDYTPKVYNEDKIKKDSSEMFIELSKTQDILFKLGVNRKPGQFLCGFSMETENMVENSREKLKKKNLDMIVANNLKEAGAGFGTDTNRVTLITEEEEIRLPLMSKMDVAKEILDKIMLGRLYWGV